MCRKYSTETILVIAYHLELHIYGDDASNTFAHSAGPYVLTFVSIYDQFYDFYRHKFGDNIDEDKVLPVLIYLQGHPKSGRIWESLINQIMK